MRKKILTLVTGAIGGQVLAFAVLPIISRIYSPEQLGEFQLMLAFCNTVGVVSALSLERALLLDLSDRMSEVLRKLCLLTVLATSFLSIPLYEVYSYMVLAAPVFIGGLPVLLFVFFTVLFRGFFLVEYTASISEERFRRASFSVFSKDVGRIVSRVGLGLTVLNPIGLFVAGVVDWMTGLITVRRYKRKHYSIHRAEFLEALRAYKEYPAFYAPAAAMTTLTSQMPVLLLGTFYPVREAGLYSLAFLLLDRPSRIVAKASGDVLSHRMARSKEVTSKSRILREASILSSLNLVALLLIAGITASLSGAVLGDDWSDVGRLAFACVPHALALFVSDLSIGLFAVVSRTMAGFFRQLASLLILVLVFGLAYAGGFSVSTTIFSAGCAHLLMQVLFLAHFAREVQLDRLKGGR